MADTIGSRCNRCATEAIWMGAVRGWVGVRGGKCPSVPRAAGLSAGGPAPAAAVPPPARTSRRPRHPSCLAPAQKLAAHYAGSTAFLKFFGNSNDSTKALFKERLKTRSTPSFYMFRDGKKWGRTLGRHSGAGLVASCHRWVCRVAGCCSRESGRVGWGWEAGCLVHRLGERARRTGLARWPAQPAQAPPLPAGMLLGSCTGAKPDNLEAHLRAALGPDAGGVPALYPQAP